MFNSERIKIILKIAVSGIPIYSSKKTYEALGEFIPSLSQAFTECLLYAKPVGSTGAEREQSCNQTAARGEEESDEKY